MAQQTQLVVSYGTSSSATLSIPPAQINTATGVTDYSNAIQNIVKAGGFFLPGTSSWIPYSQVTEIVAQ
jgi:hypothetical protein